MNKVFKSNLYFLIIILISIFVPSLILSPIYSVLGITNPLLILALNHITIFLIPAIIYTIITKSNPKELFRLNKLHLKDLLIVILIAFMCQPIMTACSSISLLFFKNEIGNFMLEVSDTSVIILTLVIAIMPAITEEVTLRGVVLSGYNNKSKMKASIMVGLFFGIFHLDAQQFLYTAVMGFITAYVVRVTNSIFSSMIIHFLINGSSLALQQLIIKIMGNSYMQEAFKQASNTTFQDNLMVAKVWVAIGCCFVPIVYALIKVLEKWNIKRDIEGYKTQLEIEKNDKEKIINTPLILIIVFYLIYMIFFGRH